ncbi:MAG: chemotaxis protein [Cyanobacteria bacterium SW_9_44_58]|nr:MAG: chemotaxis protein [Cyanobacteria bacterium SW_9_44_58]
MASGIQHQNQYEKARNAYIKGNCEEAAAILEELVKHSPTAPEVLLLRGHIYCYFQDFERAKEQYNLVIENTDSEDYIEFANSGLETVRQWQESEEFGDFSQTEAGESELEPTELVANSEEEVTGIWSDEEDTANGFNQPSQDSDAESESDDAGEQAEASINPFEDLSEQEITAISALEDDGEEMTDLAEPSFSNHQFEEEEPEATQVNPSQQTNADSKEEASAAETKTFLSSPQNRQSSQNEANFEEEEFDFSQFNNEAFSEQEPNNQETRDDAGADNQVTESLEELEKESPNFALDEVETGHFETPAQAASETAPPASEQGEAEQPLFTRSPTDGESQLFASSASKQARSDVSFEADTQVSEPVIDREQGFFAFLENASLEKKRRIIAGTAGIASAVAVAAGSFAVSTVGENKPSWLQNLAQSSVVGLVGGVASGAATWGIGGLVVKQVKRSTGDLQAQLYAVQQGNLEAKATVYSQDEFGELATGFNQMTRVVSTTTKEAQRKAQEQEQAKEDLQRQVIRLLDDVEGAARGDLTVQAEVSADVLGAVADAFNLTIRNLRAIVQQVKEAAQQVSEGAAESESFARGLSEDALKQAEELAVSLNFSQMMTESIQRVADNAKEAESVARTASETALKGGEAVDSTVAGILQIRETVAQSTRKVKRLAESFQEISKIVSVISQIATRTNNLALNASIEAARAGEAGRGFAVIADEVRQLADRSTKSLREIEKIVLQIQSETNSVMIAMEEGTQQVIEGTERAEQAKNALEEIIQVSNRIDSLVQSITADTVEQSETAQSVAQVMQSVEKTAQGTSQESQQVSTALQNLVSLSGDLLASVERFRVNSEDQQNQSK